MPPVQQLENNVQCITAPNPSPMTYRGTNTYLIGSQNRAVIDPGPDIPSHCEAILEAAAGAVIEAIFVTHAHLDHSPLAPGLAQRTGAPVYAFGPYTAGRSVEMTALANASTPIGGGEGIDAEFQPDHCLADGEKVTGNGWQIEAIWTPGHMSNHMCFAYGDLLFTGDHVMGWASSLVSPPDGDLTAFMASCAKLQLRQDRVYYPGHGDPVTSPEKRLNWLIAHRKSREAEILRALADTPDTASGLVRRIYHDIDPALHAAAERNVLAHLIDLTGRGLINHSGNLSLTTRFRAG